jgi:hypothetical protein
MPGDVIAARALLTGAANAIGYPGPRDDQGLAEWASSTIGTTLIRGSAGWQEAHALVLMALEAALFGDAARTTEALTHARNAVLHHAAHLCGCEPFGRVTLAHPGGLIGCIRCGKRTA